MNDLIVMKRFEIVVKLEHHDPLTELLKRSGILGYTVMKSAGGLGAPGIRNPDDLLLPDENTVTVFICNEDLAQKMLDELRPAMKDFGGICLITDCHAQTHSNYQGRTLQISE
ncbi:P-II family nitrogen regulator [Nitrosomonas supralitoralis]|uniref:Transcriptional regulator n=1 Tax=Nitrosomonas supralitoralis TaxID=2116706 RepID=A0A2P7NY12_9PROT|nr:transcriptional regulator [Nitrosomonas supralitoralis]PSJ18358.1 transcriptional regulator [Nitrosomonas supralitoralis]